MVDPSEMTSPSSFVMKTPTATRPVSCSIEVTAPPDTRVSPKQDAGPLEYPKDTKSALSPIQLITT